ncbi:AAA family ATPase [Priestia koreensis]|uniref:AAA family ATPase n=1 Tax=Priestia koreensis TaxID=284581 RepID=UPI00345A6B47
MPKIDTSIQELIQELSIAPSGLKVDYEKVLKEVQRSGLFISDLVIKRIVSAINSGKHVILTGPPGTAKTTLAKIVGTVAQGSEPIFTTASSDWSVSDTLGGYMPNASDPRKLQFETGIVLQSIIDRKWIIIDEINRAQIDKCLGPLFSLLSDNEVELTYRNENTKNRFRIAIGNGQNTEDLFFKTDNWRLIATMNEYDKTSLFEMSSAFLRRFAIIPVGIPNDYSSLIESWSSGLKQEIVDNLIKIVNGIEKGKIREIGPALFKDLIDYLQERKNIDDDFVMHYSEGLAIFLLPQFQGIDDLDVEALRVVCGELLRGNSLALDFFDKTLLYYVG